MRLFFPCLLLIFAGYGPAPARAQPATHWIFFTNKDSTSLPALAPAARLSRTARHLALDETDRPVATTYLARLGQLGIGVKCRSRWFNAVSARLTPAQCRVVGRLPFVRQVGRVAAGVVVMARPAPRENPAKLAPVLTQIQSEAFAAAGLTGRFVPVGVIDAGFFGADSAAVLRPIASRGGFRQVRDYVNQPATRNQLFRTLETMSDLHGTEVLAAIGGHDPVGQLQLGLGYDASFYLARTDAGNRESRAEEDNWIQAIEWLDSLGVRLVNTSLGYAKGFTDPAENYRPGQMDGHTSLISRAAQLATDKKGMLIIVSAGNEGDDHSWRVISTPADAEGVLAVGATNARLWNRISYSSIGPEALPYLKPNVACFSLYGTSLAAPVITGFAACLLQANPALTNRQLRDIIEQSAHLYPYGNNFVGYGVPQAKRALALLRGETPAPTARQLQVTGRKCTVPIAVPNQLVTLFRKRDATHVIQQAVGKVSHGQLTLRQQPGERFTTIDLKTEVIEVVW